MPKSPFTDVEVRLIHRAATSVWQEIAMDIFQASADMWNYEHKKKKKTVHDIRIPRRDVIELVLDANRLDDMLRRALGKEHGNELAKKISFAENRHVMKILRDAFPFSHYGT